jgi:N-acetylglucosaminyldiphosphoundecaprenol N-acetyl-beta-D-mannosaminyltransferase
MRNRLKIISLNVDNISFNHGLDQVMDLAIQKRSSYVCFGSVHMTIEAYKNNLFSEKVNAADILFADGKPIALACSLLHHKKQERICGPDFAPAILKKANEKKLSVFIYGSTEEVINACKEKIAKEFPDIHFAGAISPPFRTLTDEELNNDIEKINRSGAQLVFVALGCPRQEEWVANNSSKLNAVLLAVGAAIPFFAGFEKRAPKWMQNMSLEWFYRLMQQPKRLFGRYFYTNSYFLFLLGREWIKSIFKKNADKDK